MSESALEEYLRIAESTGEPKRPMTCYSCGVEGPPAILRLVRGDLVNCCGICISKPLSEEERAIPDWKAKGWFSPEPMDLKRY